MNKLLIYILLSVFLFANVVNAGGLSSPMPVAIKVLTYYPSDAVDLGVVITDNSHLYSMYLTTNENGEIMADWGNSPVRGYIGDSFEIKVQDTVVSSTMTDSGLGNGVITVDLRNPVCPMPKPCLPYVEGTSSDPTPYSKDTCQVTQVTTTNTKYVCSDGTVSDTTACPVVSTLKPADWTNTEVFSVLVALAVIFGAYKGYFRFQIKKKKVSSTGTVSYVYVTIFEKTSTKNTITPKPV